MDSERPRVRADHGATELVRTQQPAVAHHRRSVHHRRGGAHFRGHLLPLRGRRSPIEHLYGDAADVQRVPQGRTPLQSLPRRSAADASQHRGERLERTRGHLHGVDTLAHITSHSLTHHIIAFDCTTLAHTSPASILTSLTRHCHTARSLTTSFISHRNCDISF
jgi:hypothetical protein